MDTQKETTPATGSRDEAAKLALDAAILKDNTEAITILKRVIKDDVRNASKTSKGVFEAIVLAGDLAECKGIFAKAEEQLVQEWKKENEAIKSFSDIGKISGTGTLSYTNIKNTMLKAVNEADELVKQLQAYYDFQYECMTKAEQAENAHKVVEEGFLNPWHSRYVKRTEDDEHGSTKFNRDRKEANDAKGLHDSAKRERDRAKAKAEEEAAKRLAEAAKRSGMVADNAPAGSGSTAQGFAGGTRGDVVLSAVVQSGFNMLKNAVFSASQYLADSEVLPILANAHDKLVALVEAEKEIERKKTADQSRSHDNPVGEQTELEDGEVSLLPDLDPSDDSDMTDADKENLAAAIEQDLERKAK